MVMSQQSRSSSSLLEVIVRRRRSPSPSPFAVRRSPFAVRWALFAVRCSGSRFFCLLAPVFGNMFAPAGERSSQVS